MNFSIIHSAQNNVLEASKVDVEADISNGLYSFAVVGLADKAVEESKDRISSAIKNSGFLSPKKKNQKIVMSLAPASIKKVGPNFDLPMALAYLKSSGVIKFNSKDKLFIGELSLDGKLRKVSGILPIIILAKKLKFSEIYIPSMNSKESSLIKGIKILAFDSLLEVTDHLLGKKVKKPLSNLRIKNLVAAENKKYRPSSRNSLLLQIKGQETAKRGLEIAAAGGHSIGFHGPPGTGKTLLARSIVEILPSLKYEQIIESTSIHSVSNLNNNLLTNPPFRNPHHTSTHSSIIGGGSYLRPGEISLAHNGVLFMDEMPEFDRKIIESLRQPLEDGYIALSRLHQKAVLPTDFILIIAMNPCPCGYHKSNSKKCTCSLNLIEKYRKKISGPIIDRIDMWIEVNNIENKKLTSNNSRDYAGISRLRANIIEARKTQVKRFGKYKLNARISPSEILAQCRLSPKTDALLNKSSEKLSLSPRSYHKVLKLSRTIADLERSESIEESHVLEALQYRPKFL